MTWPDNGAEIAERLLSYRASAEESWALLFKYTSTFSGVDSGGGCGAAVFVLSFLSRPVQVLHQRVVELLLLLAVESESFPTVLCPVPSTTEPCHKRASRRNWDRGHGCAVVYNPLMYTISSRTFTNNTPPVPHIWRPVGLCLCCRI